MPGVSGSPTSSGDKAYVDTKDKRLKPVPDTVNEDTETSPRFVLRRRRTVADL